MQYKSQKIIRFANQHKLFLLFTVTYFAIAIITYKDYGVTFDEKVEYDSGKFLLTYYKNATTFPYIQDKLVTNKPIHMEHRQLPLYSIYSRIYPMLLNILNPNYYFEWFHLQNLIAGYFLFLFAYLLFYLVYKNGNKAIIAPILLLLTPTISGHIPANPKDIPFATAFLLGILAITFFIRHKANKKLEILALGLVFGIAQSQRTVGLTLFFTYLVMGALLSKDKKALLDHMLNAILIFLVSLVFWIIFLPFLGANLFANMGELLSNASGYKEWDYEVFYLGKYLFKDQRPWHYLYAYLLVKLPLVILAGLVLGIVGLATKCLKYDKTHPIILLLFIFLLNSVLYIALHPIIYNAIRHFLYLVVCITLTGSFFLIDFISKLNGRYKIVISFTAVFYATFTLLRMIHLHPYEYIYYNETLGGLRGAEKLFELEYWGASYKESAQYALNLVKKYDIKDLKLYSCDNQFAVVYFSQFQYELVNRSQDAEIVICDTFKDTLRGYYGNTHPLIHTIDREGVTIHNIRAKPEFIEKYNL